MKRKFFFIVFSLASLALQAQSVPYLHVPADARALSMGGAALALEADAFALTHNPAAPAMAPQKAALGLSYGSWQPTASQGTLYDGGGFLKVGSALALGLSGRYFTQGAYDVTDANGLVAGEFIPKDLDVAVGASYRIADFLSVGASVRYTTSTLGEEAKASAVSADLALMARIKGAQLALGLVHLGSQLDYGAGGYSLPTAIQLGAAYPLAPAPDHRLTLSVEGDYLVNDSAFMAGAGLEYAFKNLVFVRAGYHYGDALKAIPGYASVGAGVKVAGISLCGAYLLAGGDSPLKNSLSLSLGFEIAPKH